MNCNASLAFRIFEPLDAAKGHTEFHALVEAQTIDAINHLTPSRISELDRVANWST
jgi:hypothetical protein